MRIVIVGLGRMGYSLAQQLDSEEHTVYAVDPVSTQVELARTRLDIMAVCGSGCNLEVMKDLGVEGADLLIAVSGSDEVNIVSCLISRELGVQRRIARIESHDLAKNLRHIPPSVLAVDEFVNPREVTVGRLHEIVSTPGTTMSAEFARGEILLRGLWVEKTSELTEHPLMELQSLFADHFLVAAVKRGENLFVPKGAFRIEVGDNIFVVLNATMLDSFLRQFHFTKPKTRRVFAYGAHGIALDLCQRLEREIADVVLLDQDWNRRKRASDFLKNTSIIDGSPLDRTLMVELKVDTGDYFLGLSESEESNFSSALMAKRLGVKSALMITDRPTHVDLFDTLPLDAVVSPAILCVGAILRLARAGSVISMFKIAGERGEAVEIEAQAGSVAAGRALKDIEFPAGAVVAAVTGVKSSRIAAGDTVVEPGDRVILVAKAEAIRPAISLFTA